MSDNITLSGVHSSRHLLHMASRGWQRALGKVGFERLAAGAAKDSEGGTENLNKAAKVWAWESGLRGYRQLGGFVTVTLATVQARKKWRKRG